MRNLEGSANIQKEFFMFARRKPMVRRGNFRQFQKNKQVRDSMFVLIKVFTPKKIVKNQHTARYFSGVTLLICAHCLAYGASLKADTIPMNLERKFRGSFLDIHKYYGCSPGGVGFLILGEILRGIVAIRKRARHLGRD
jgi:hypothetical protein